jgi:hypothetical protein
MRSIELQWLSRRDRTLPLPNIIFKKEFVGGRYYHPDPTYEVYDDDGKPHGCNNGLIVISTEFEGEDATIAHEWRHHYQAHMGTSNYDSLGWKEDGRDYKEKIIEYFLTSKDEMDALRFQLSLCPAGVLEDWVEWLYPHVKDVIRRPTFFC